MSPVLLLLAFLAGALLLLGFASIWSDLHRRDSARISRRMDDEMRKRNREQIQQSILFKNKKNKEAMELFEEEKAPPTFREKFRNMVERSGLNMTQERLIALMAA